MNFIPGDLLPEIGRVNVLHKRDVNSNMKKDKRFLERKKIYPSEKKSQNVKGKKGESVQNKVKQISKDRKLGRKEKEVTNNVKKRKKASNRKKNMRKKKIMQKKRSKRRNAELVTCTNLWAELTNVGFGLASTLVKQVEIGHFVDLKDSKLSGKLYKK